MKPIITGLMVMGLCLCAVLAGETVYPKARLTFHVVDDTGKAIAGMPMKMGFGDEEDTKGQTDANGRFVFEGKATSWELYYSAAKTGWYRTHARYEFSPEPKDGRMLPWNPVVTTVVRKVVNPRALYAKRVETRMPKENEWIGFDLQIGDWTEPYGKGKSRDFIFRLTRRVVSPDDYEGTLFLAFTHAMDGIQKIGGIFDASDFRMPRYAFETGYGSNYTYQVGRNPQRGKYGAHVDDPREYHFFRVRSVIGIDGALKESLYGKMHGRITFGGVLATNKARITFTYYLNPTPNDRNLEFDPQRNLFKDLKSTEEVTEP